MCVVKEKKEEQTKGKHLTFCMRKQKGLEQRPELARRKIR
jgi:hypothetical protein